MTPLFTITVLVALIAPQLDIWRQAQSELGCLSAKFDLMSELALAEDFGRPPVIYFDAPPRANGGVMRH